MTSGQSGSVVEDRGESRGVVVGFALSRARRDELKRIAESKGMRMSVYVRVLVVAALAEEEEKERLRSSSC